MFDCFKDKVFLKKFLKLALPVMIAGLVSFIVTFLDNIMVGAVSNETVSGVYAANEVSFIVQMFIFGILEGAGIFIQQYMGSNDKEHVKQCFRFKVLATVLSIVIVIPLVFFFGKYLIHFFCKSDSNYDLIYKEGVDYLGILIFSYIPFMISYAFSTSLNEIGKTKYTMASGFVAIVSNATFNAIFIFGLKMGGVGAAIATVIARTIEMIFLITISYAKKAEFTIGFFEKFTIEKKLGKAITKKSIFLFLNELGWTLGILLQSLAYSQRDGVLSAISITSTISNVFQILANSLAVGIGVIVGNYLGINKFDEAIDANRKLNYLALYLSLGLGLLIVLLSPVIPLMFPEVDASQKALATKLLIVYGALMFGHVLSVTSYFTLRVGGKTGITFFFDTGLMLTLYIPVAWILALFTNIYIVYLYLIVTGIDVLKAFVGIIIVKRKTWVKNITIISET